MLEKRSFMCEILGNTGYLNFSANSGMDTWKNIQMYVAYTAKGKEGMGA